MTPGSGQVGEIVGRGPHVTLGYHGATATTQQAFRDGGYRTGDLATVDADGFVTIVGRANEMIKTGGHRAAPAEIEHVLAQAAGVAEAAVCGIPHDVRGEAVIGVVIASTGATLTEPALRAHCAARLPPHLVPVRFRIVAELPRTANGKLDRAALRRQSLPTDGTP